jgi:polyphosphate kinase
MAAGKEALGPASAPRLDEPRLFFNRELSLLAFQKRVLEEAKDSANPLLERVMFLSIFASNLDEFYMVRVAVLKQRVTSGVHEAGLDGLTGSELLDAIRVRVIELTSDAYRCLRDDLAPALRRAGLTLLNYSELEDAERASLDAYFHHTIFPVLTPLAFDPGRPFPHISNLSLNLSVVVRDAKDVDHFARVKVPPTLPQLIPVARGFVWLEQVIIANLQALFPGLEVREAHPFHVTRDAEVAIQELESDDLLETIEEAVWRRRFRSVVRLQVDASVPPHILDILKENLEVGAKDIYSVEGPLDLSRIRQLYSVDRPDLRYKPQAPFTPPELLPKSKEDVFGLIRRGDVLLHHPFESFQPVVEFIRAAARDPHVLAIKMTLYRVGRNSPIVQALLEGIQEGKQVSVLLELKARFDEESNIGWARALEREGVHVVYGLVGLKVHSKIALVVRREEDVIRRYLHMGTGNYNASTARIYTDLSMFTCNEAAGADASDLFNYLTGYSAKEDFLKLCVAPINLRQRVANLINREIEHGAKGRLIFKMNALEDPGMIELLYKASQAGVRVDLLVRGLCCLRPGLPGISENIRVISIIGRFLEHSRIYYFRNGGAEEVYAGSADLMPRNLDRRVEILFPVEDPNVVRRVHDEILDVYLADNVNAYRMESDGGYTRAPRSETAGGIDSHQRASR